MKPPRTRILCVDDEPSVVEGLRDVLRRHYRVTGAGSGAEGLERLRTDGPFAVVISDMRMPEMDGAEFLEAVRSAAPDTVRILLTGQSDLAAAIAAVNRGQIFRFLTKPCEPRDLLEALSSGVRQHQLVTAERDLLDRTLKGSITVLTDVLSVVQPAAFARSVRVRRIASHVAERLSLSPAWTVEIAAMLQQIGTVTLAPETVERAWTGRTLSEADEKQLDTVPRATAKLLARIPRLEPVARIVANEPDANRPAEQTAAAILQAAVAFDLQLHRSGDRLGALRALGASGTDAAILEALADAPLENAGGIRVVRVDQLTTGMALEQDVRSNTGVLLAARGQTMTWSLLGRLRNIDRGAGVQGPIRVRCSA